MVTSPLEQFEVIPLWCLGLGDKFAFTNASFFAAAALVGLLSFLSFGTTQATLVPHRWQIVAENAFEFVLDFMKDTLGEKGMKYFPWIFSSFCMVLGLNLIGMIPYTFTVTSHIAMTFAFGLATFIGINIVGFREHGFHFISIFLPKEAPLALAPFLVLIEFVSYIFRVFSLAIRLFANMMAGHSLLKILAGFGWTMLTMGGIFYVVQLVPFVVVLALTGLELGIGFLQAYVWSVLVCIYLNDALNLH